MNTVIGLVGTLLGAVFGSFANVCIYRLPRNESIAWPPSHCPHCGQRILPWQLVPILSWLILKGRCAKCNQAISWQYPLVEMVTALLFGLIGFRWGYSLETLRYIILIWALVIAVGTDFSHRIIPDSISLGASAVLALLALVSLDWAAILGGVLLFVILFLIAIASRGGMGGGDIKLALAIGLALGWQSGLIALLVSFFGGGLISVGILLFSRKGGRKTEVPFGPFLAVGAVVAMFWSTEIIQLYWDFTLLLWGW